MEMKKAPDKLETRIPDAAQAGMTKPEFVLYSLSFFYSVAFFVF